MIVKDGICTFLESPFSLDLFCPDAQECCKKVDSASASTPRRRKKRKEGLPPYIPYKSVYEQSDLSRLTERQRIMALKFQTNITNINKLFLEVNGIYLQAKKGGGLCKETCPDAGKKGGVSGGCIEEKNGVFCTGVQDHGESGRVQVNKPGNKILSSADNNRMYKFLQISQSTKKHKGVAQNEPGTLQASVFVSRRKKAGLKTEGGSAILGAISDTCQIVPIRLKIKPLNVRLPFSSTVTCERCKKGICDLLKFFNWAHSVHTCEYRGEIKQIRNRLVFLVGNSPCVCALERDFFDEAFKITDLECC